MARDQAAADGLKLTFAFYILIYSSVSSSVELNQEVFIPSISGSQE